MVLEFTVPLKEPDRRVVVVLEFTVPLTRWKQRAQQTVGSGTVVYCTFNTVEAKSPTDGW